MDGGFLLFAIYNEDNAVKAKVLQVVYDMPSHPVGMLFRVGLRFNVLRQFKRSRTPSAPKCVSLRAGMKGLSQCEPHFLPSKKSCGGSIIVSSNTATHHLSQVGMGKVSGGSMQSQRTSGYVPSAMLASQTPKHLRVLEAT